MVRGKSQMIERIHFAESLGLNHLMNTVLNPNFFLFFTNFVRFKYFILSFLELALESTILDDVRNARVLGAEPLRTQTLPDSVISSWWSNTRKGGRISEVIFNLIPSIEI